MPRNGAGTFFVLNPIVVGALRSSSAVNANFTDMGDEITNSLPLNGEAGMSGPFRASDGSEIAPGIAFDLDSNVGFRRPAVDEMAWVAGGSDRATMDAAGKLTLHGGVEVSGALTHSSGEFGRQTLAGTGSARAALRRTENDTSEHEITSYESGSGAGAKASLRVVGGGSNDVATMRFYVNDVLAFQWTGSLFTHSVDTLFGASGIRGDTDGFLDFPEITAAPSSPASNVARLYARDDGGGTTRLYFKDGAGNETTLQPPLDRQIFTESAVWTKPTQGQTMALLECWAGGGSGGTGRAPVGDNLAGGGGGGGAYIRKIIALASLSASVAVTVGSGGAALSANESTGNTGGNSSFGSYASAFGGGPGLRAASGDFISGGGGGGLLSEGIVVVDAGNSGGNPAGLDSTVPAAFGSEGWGGSNGAETMSNPFGGGAGGDDGAGGQAFFGGGGGGQGRRNNAGGENGGSSIYGGGGGGGGSGSGTIGFAGTSIFGGNGGNGANNLSTAQSGSVPAGGGGGASGGSSGAGARGEVRITCW